jgi:hypothetical protein
MTGWDGVVVPDALDRELERRIDSGAPLAARPSDRAGAARPLPAPLNGTASS